jgi:putative transposase
VGEKASYESREGKTVYISTYTGKGPAGDESLGEHMEIVFQVTERSIDKRGNLLHIPEIEVATYWTNLYEEPEPAIFNTDQGSQFTSDAFIDVLKGHSIEISMDGKGRALDNVYVERLWRTLKYEDIYLKSYETMVQLADGVDRYFQFYNSERFHQSLDYRTPDEMHESFVPENTLPLAA